MHKSSPAANFSYPPTKKKKKCNQPITITYSDDSFNCMVNLHRSSLPCHHLSSVSYRKFYIYIPKYSFPPSQSPCLQCKNVGIGVIPIWHISSLLSSWAAGSICVKGARKRGERRRRKKRGREERKEEIGEEAERQKGQG